MNHLKINQFKCFVDADININQLTIMAGANGNGSLINEKLKKLNEFTCTWTRGTFDYKNLGLDNSPDTPTRVASTLNLRSFIGYIGPKADIGFD